MHEILSGLETATRRSPAFPSLPMSFFNIVAFLGVFVFTPYTGASSIALVDAGSGSASRGEQLQVAVAPREAVAGEDVSGLSEGQRAVEDMMQSMRNEWEAENGWGWIPPQQPRKRSGDTVKGMSPQERMVKMLQFDFAPLVEDILLSNAQRLAAVAAVAPDVPEDSSAGKTAPITKTIDESSNSDAANQSSNLELDQVVKKVMKATERKEAHGGVTSPVALGAGESAKTKEMTAHVTADIVRHLLRRADIASNVSDSEMAATTERELEAMEREKQQATSPAPTPLGQVIRKVARVTADLVKKMQKRSSKAMHDKRRAQQLKVHPTTTTQATESHAAEAAVVAAAASAASCAMDKKKDTSSKDTDSPSRNTETPPLGNKKRGSELFAANSDVLEKIALRHDVDPIVKDRTNPTSVQKWGESVQFPESPKMKKVGNSITMITGDAGKVIPTGLEWSAPGEVKLIEIKADVDEKRPERLAEVLEMDDTKNAADSDLEWLRFAYESPLIKEVAPLNERNKRKLDGNLFEESLKDMGGEIHDRASAIQDNRINLMERNAMFPTIEETLKDLVERAIEENLLSAERSFWSDIGVNESGSGSTKKDEAGNKSGRHQKEDQLNASLVKDKRADKVVSNKTVSGNANTKGQQHKEPRLLEIKGAYWRVPEKENGVTSSSRMDRTGDPLKLKRQTKDKVSDTSSNLSENGTKTIQRLEDSEAPPSSSDSANSSEQEHPPNPDNPMPDSFSLKETVEKDILPFETNVSHERPLEKPKRDDEHDTGKINLHSTAEKELDDSNLDAIEKTEVPETSVVDLVTKDKEADATDTSDTPETVHISTADVDGSKNTESSSEEEEDTGSPPTSTEAHEEDFVDADAPRAAEGGGGGGGGGGEEGDEAVALADATDDQQINDTTATLEYRQGYGRASTKSLLCYQCRSDKMSDCGGSDPPKKWLKECKFDEPPERPVCRLIKREIDTSSGKKDLVLRMCGSSSASPDGGCYESLWGQQTTCECLTNACNGAISALKRAASLSSSKTLMQGEEQEFQSSGTNSVPWSLVYAAMPLGTILSSRVALFVY